MDKLSEHAIRMLEVIEDERGYFKNMDRDVADIASAVYDLILQVQMLKTQREKQAEQIAKLERRVQTLEAKAKKV